jgi:hypothetical protein
LGLRRRSVLRAVRMIGERQEKDRRPILRIGLCL